MRLTVRMVHQQVRDHRARAGAVGALFAALTVFAILALAGGARAAIAEPAEGATVSGDVTITEDRGGTFVCDAHLGRRTDTRIEVLRDGAVVAAWEKGSPGALTVTWATVGVHPDGPYTIRSLKLEPRIGWPCFHGSWIEIDRVDVTLGNGAPPTLLALDAAPDGYALEDATFTATLTDATPERTPLAGRALSFTLGAASATATTGPDGVASVTFPLDQGPGALEASVEYAGEPEHAPSTASAGFEILPRVTLVTYDGTRDGVRGTVVSLSARLTDATPGSALAGTPLAGAPVRLALADAESELTTDDAGRVALDVLVEAAYGTHPLVAAFDGSLHHEAARAALEFEVLWEFVFHDSAGAGTVNLNTITRELQLVTPTGSSSVKSSGGTLASWGDAAAESSTDACALGPGNACRARVVQLAYADEELALVGAFDLESGRFAAVARTETGPLVLRGPALVPCVDAAAAACPLPSVERPVEAAVRIRMPA